MKKIKSKFELYQRIDDLHDRYHTIKLTMTALHSQLTEANITMERVGEAMDRLKGAEITTELMVTEETKTEQATNYWNYFVFFVLGAVIGTLLGLFKLF